MTKFTRSFPAAAAALAVLFVATPAFAAEHSDELWRGYVGLGAGLTMGLAALGGTLGQGMAARAAFESIARNPSAAGALNVPFFVGMALIESLVLFAFAVAFLLNGNVVATLG